MTEYLMVIKKSLIESDFVHNVDKVLKKALDPITVDELRIRITRLSGKILDRLYQCQLS